MQQCAEIRALVEHENALTVNAMQQGLAQRHARRAPLTRGLGALRGGGRFGALLVPLLVMLSSMVLGWAWATYAAPDLGPLAAPRPGARRHGRGITWWVMA